MSVGVDELYLNLNKLLEDICRFLTDEENYEKLSPLARKRANELIARSKKQLQEIAQIGPENSSNDGAYVDMERKSENNEDEPNNFYSSVDEATVSTIPAFKDELNPYANLPAKELVRDSKHGYLSWRCKFILKFEKMRRIYAGVCTNWLLIYSSEKDSKPFQSFNLKFHRARNVISKNKNLRQDFELIFVSGEPKTYYFTASTHKDMLQWIAHINRCFDEFNQPDNVTTSEAYDINGQTNNEDDPEDAYQDIELYLRSEEEPKEVRAKEPPDLPTRPPKKSTTPLPKLPSRKNETDACECSGDKSSTPSINSFSPDEDEEEVYQSFCPKTDDDTLPRRTTLSNVKKPTNDTNGIDKEKPKPPLKPKIVKELSKRFLAPKK